MNLKKVLSIALLCAASHTAFSAGYLDDNFATYLNGDLVGQGDWLQTGSASNNPIQVVDGKVILGASGQDAYKAFSSVAENTPGTTLYSIIELSISSATATGDYFFHLSDPAGTTTNFYQRLFARSSGEGFQFGLLDTAGTGSSTTWGSTVLSFDTTYTVKIGWNFVEGPNNDTFEVWVDGVSYLTHTWTSTSVAEPAQLAAANLRQGGNNSSASVQVSSLQVVPEPGTYAMLLLGGGLTFLMLRRRR